MIDRIFDYPLIPEFGGTAADKPVIEWILCIEII